MLISPISLDDDDLFGNDAAELETDEVFNSYVYERPELQQFLHPNKVMCIARAYKGEGKSALLRLCRIRLAQNSSNDMIISKSGVDLSPNIDTVDSDDWVRAWKIKLANEVAAAVGREIGFAGTDDSMALVEHAERTSDKSKNIIAAILERIRIKFAGELITAEVKKSSEPRNFEKIIARYSNGDSNIWFIVDDIDQNFQNSEKNRVRVCAFFTACRMLMQTVPNLRFRVAIRPNVWVTLKHSYEALSHLEQYTVDLVWHDSDIRSLLAKRIEGYCDRHKITTLFKGLPDRAERDVYEEALIGRVFSPLLPWGEKSDSGKSKPLRPAHIVLSTLCRRRPRWTIEISRLAAVRAAKQRKQQIDMESIDAELLEFGQRRLEDTCAEFLADCPQIQAVIQGFANGVDEYSTSDLIVKIKNGIQPQVRVFISGSTIPATDVQIAQFLYKIGFITAKVYRTDGYEHYSYVERPNLLVSSTNLDQGSRWEIHPVFRQALSLRRSNNTRRPRQ